MTRSRTGGPTALCVFCASSEAIDPHHVALAAEVGAAVAARGWVLVSGGGSVSSMGAVARSARAGGARTVGVIPAVLVALEVADHDADDLVVTDDMRARKGLMDSHADAFLVLAGGLGTLEELLEAWVARSLGLHRKPVVVLDPDGVFAPLRDQVQSLLAGGFVRPQALDALVWTTSVDEAFAAIEAGLAAAGPPAPPADAAEWLEAEP